MVEKRPYKKARHAAHSGVQPPPHLLKGKADIRQIQKLLGHRRLSSTEIYTHVELGDLAEVISRCHPREKR
ncbi:MAG: tyrosine-type recombinase/integrase [Acidobacteria bacterium]|nr:tyrosine-type recombinase/integrase [Acidobacteriota bacterium]